MGHTMSIHSQNEQVILEFGLKKPAFRIVVNTPTTHGSIGLTTGLDPGDDARAAAATAATSRRTVLSQLPEIVHRLDQLSMLILQPSHVEGSITFFQLVCGQISGPIQFNIQASEHAKSQSMEARIQQALSAFPQAEKISALQAMEHIALVKRWYYRGSRVGEAFFADAKGELPMRRIVRGVSRVFRGEKPERETPNPLPDSSAPQEPKTAP